MEQNAFDLGEEHLTLHPIITGASVTQSLLVHSSIVPWSQCPPAPIQLAAVEVSLPLPLHMLSKLWVGLDGCCGRGGVDFCRETELPKLKQHWAKEEATADPTARFQSSAPSYIYLQL